MWIYMYTYIQCIISSQKNCADLAGKNESSEFLIPCPDVNFISVRAFCIERKKW